MGYSIKNRSICWYCANACNLHKCSIAHGKEPTNIVKKNGFVTQCKNFVQDVPLPLTREEFKNKFGISINSVWHYWNNLDKLGGVDNFVKLIYIVIDNRFFYKNVIDYIRKIRAKIILQLDICKKYFVHFKSLDYCPQEFDYLFSKLNCAYDELQRKFTKCGLKTGRLELKDLGTFKNQSREH